MQDMAPAAGNGGHEGGRAELAPAGAEPAAGNGGLERGSARPARGGAEPARGGAEPARGGGSRAHDPSFRMAMGVMAAICFGGALFLAGPGSPLFWLGLLGPDLALFAGMGAGLERGQLHPRGVPYYNAVHLLVGPFLLAIASRWLGLAWLGAAAAWAAHVFLDRSLGFGLRDRRGFVR